MAWGATEALPSVATDAAGSAGTTLAGGLAQAASRAARKRAGRRFSTGTFEAGRRSLCF
jgi:hypothetical protein